MKRVGSIAIVLCACGPAVEVYVENGTSGAPGTSTGSADANDDDVDEGASSITATTMPADTSSSSGDGDDQSDDDVESDSFTFILDPDGGSCHCTECDLWAQDCPEGSKCAPWANDGGNVWNATRCSPVDPDPAAVGDPCIVEDSGVSGYDNCEISAMCWGVDPVTLVGECVAMCDGSEANPMCGEGLECLITFDGVLILCLPSCDPLAPTCSDGETCTHTPAIAPTAFSCMPTPPFTPHAYGEPCDPPALEICASGFACAEPEHVPGCAATACCTSVGELSQVPVCPDAMQTCIPFDESMPDAGLCFCGVQP